MVAVVVPFIDEDDLPGRQRQRLLPLQRVWTEGSIGVEKSRAGIVRHTRQESFYFGPGKRALPWTGLG